MPVQGSALSRIKEKRREQNAGGGGQSSQRGV